MTALDPIDRKILAILTEDGRISATQLAGRLPLSVSSTAERLRRLRSSGVISRFTIDVDPRLVGRPITVFVDLRLRRDVDKIGADRRLRDVPGVIDSCQVTGRYDYQLHIASADVEDLNATLDLLHHDIGAEETNTRLVLRTTPGFPRPPGLEPDGGD